MDPNTGVATLIGAIGFNQVGAIDFTTSGTLYGVGKRPADGTQVLLQINPLTGASTEIGPTGLSSDIQDISFRNSDGKLFAYVSSVIYTLSTATGTATLLGSAGDGFPSGNGLAFSSTDMLYKADSTSLWTINQANGSASVVTNLTYPISNSRANGMDFDNSTGILWASVTTGSGGTNYLATINVTNGSVTYIGATQHGMDALAIGPLPPPTPTAFQITSIVKQGSDIRIAWKTPVGATNALQATSGVNGSYSTNGFADIFAITNTVSTTTNYLNSGAATNAPSRYYRVRLVP